MVFGVLGQTEIYGVRNITSALQSGLKELGSQLDVSDVWQSSFHATCFMKRNHRSR